MLLFCCCLFVVAFTHFYFIIKKFFSLVSLTKYKERKKDWQYFALVSFTVQLTFDLLVQRVIVWTMDILAWHARPHIAFPQHDQQMNPTSYRALPHKSSSIEFRIRFLWWICSIQWPWYQFLHTQRNPTRAWFVAFRVEQHMDLPNSWVLQQWSVLNEFHLESFHQNAFLAPRGEDSREAVLVISLLHSTHR